MNDYEEDNAEYGVESVGWIAAHLKAKNMGWDRLIMIFSLDPYYCISSTYTDVIIYWLLLRLEDIGKETDDGAPPVPSNFTSITPLVMTPHCHAPSCIRHFQPSYYYHL